MVIPHRTARALTTIWRLNTLRIARRAFAQTSPGLILDRRMFGGVMPLNVGRTQMHQLLYLEGQRFIGERFLVQQQLSAGMQVVDVGANIGYYLLLFEQIVGPTGRVLCIEPEPDNLADLRRVIAANDFMNVHVLAAALGASQGSVQLAPGMNGIVTHEGVLTVPLTRLDDVWRNHMDRVDFVKIDVEGYEGEVLAGARRVIEDQRPRLFIELHPGMMSSGHSVGSIIESLQPFYAVQFFDVPHGSTRSKLRWKYLGEDPVQELNVHEVLDACGAGQRDATFWAICRPR